VASEDSKQEVEVRRLRQQLRQQERTNAMLAESVEHYVGTLAHDLKNPLAAIKVNVQGLLRRLERGEAVEPGYYLERLLRIDATAADMARRIAELRAAATDGAAPSRPLHIEAVDLVALAQELAQRCQALARGHPVRLEASCRELVGGWDRQQLQEAVEELLTNAIKFSPRGGDLRMSVDHEQARGESWAVLRLRDSGMGIPQRDLPHVFERFYRAENVLGQVKGSGTGLFEVRQTALRHRGSIDVDSTEDVGSVFTLRLPTDWPG
jgi:two-component system sensor histidine kinase BaeS